MGVRHHAVEIVERKLVERRHHHDSRVVDQHVEPAEGSNRLGHGVLHSVGISAVGADS